MEKLRAGARITTKDGRGGRVDSYQGEEMHIVAIQDDYEPNDHLAGYRCFPRSAIAVVNGQGFATVTTKRIPATVARKAGTASPRKAASAAIERDVACLRAWSRLAPSY